MTLAELIDSMIFSGMCAWEAHAEGSQGVTDYYAFTYEGFKKEAEKEVVRLTKVKPSKAAKIVHSALVVRWMNGCGK